MIRKHWFEILAAVIVVVFIVLAFTGHINPSK